mgnify:CR=1 FL=1
MSFQIATYLSSPLSGGTHPAWKQGMRPRYFLLLVGCSGLLLASGCGETSSSSPEGGQVAGAAMAGAGKPAAGSASGGSDSAGRGGAGGGSAGTVFDPCRGVPPPGSACIPAEQAWEWSRNPGAADPLPEPTPGMGGEGGVGNGGAGGEGGASAPTYPPGTCPSIHAIGSRLGAGAVNAGFSSGSFNNGQCCYYWGVACG